jgi:hypothetical protein
MINEQFQLKKLKESQPDQGKKVVFWLIAKIEFLVALVILLVFAVGIYFFIYPKYQEIQAIPSDNEAAQNTLNERMAYYKKLDNTRSNSSYFLSEEDMQKANFMFPDKPDIEEMYGYVESIMTRNGFLLPSLSISDGSSNAIPYQKEGKSLSPPPELGVISLSFGVSGLDYNEMKEFLVQIQNDLRIFDIIGLSYSPSGKNLDLKLQTYYRLKN